MRWLENSANQIRLLILMQKLKKFLAMLLSLPLTLPAVFIIRVLHPLVKVRLHPFSSEVIGIFAGNTEMYMCRRGQDKKRTFDIFYHNRQPCNQQLGKMWGRTLHTCGLAKQVDIMNCALPGGKSHLIPNEYFENRDIDGLLPYTPIHLSFTPREELLGLNELERMGVPAEASFICFHSRDSAYKEVMNPESDSRIYSYRDTNISNHIPAVEEMTRRGYYAIRMGAIVKEPLKTTNPMIIDYATKYRSDFMDIYLCAKCYFYLGDESGLNRVASIFRRPLANLNTIPIDQTHTQGPNDLFLLKKLWLHKESRLLTFRNIFTFGFNNFTRIEQYEQAGIEPAENTAEEITALAVEMDERLRGVWQTTKEDERLQRCFWSLFKPTGVRHGLIESRIGADFLRQNREFLD